MAESVFEPGLDMEEYLAKRALEIPDLGERKLFKDVVEKMLIELYHYTQGEYAARCQVKEKESTLIELTLTVPTEEQASSICANWKQKNEKVYAYLMEELL